MYVCLCQGVTDNQIHDAICEGCCSYREVHEATGIGTQYGKYTYLAKQVIRETLNDLQSAQPVSAFGTAALIAA